MRDFLRGWRRKMGLALLGMALLLTVGWFRSMVIQDEYWTMIGGEMYGTDSANGDFVIFREVASDYDMRGGRYIHIAYLHGGSPLDNFSPPEFGKEWSHSAAGISINCITAQTGQMNRLGQPRMFHVIRCPYWELVLVLTLIAAALILPPQRRANRGTSAAPDASSQSVSAAPTTPPRSSPEH